MTLIAKILSNPTYEPPEILLELDLNNGLKGLLGSPIVSREILVRFAIGEAELVLPVFEEVYPSDDRPRKAIQAAQEWLVNPNKVYADAAVEAAAAAWAAADTAYARAAAAYAAARAAYYAAAAAGAADGATAWAAYWAAAGAAYWVREADPSITVEDQIRRFFELFGSPVGCRGVG